MSDSQLVPVKETSSEIVLIKPTKKWAPLDFKELWRYRELIYFLTWRDVKVRYAQTILGATWVILQPLIQMFVFNFIFGTIADLPTEGIPRPLFTYAGLLGWNLFSKGMTVAGKSMVANRNMITKIYFPRLILPLSSILSGLVDFAVSSVIMIILMIIYKTPPHGEYLGIAFVYVVGNYYFFGNWVVVGTVERALSRYSVYYPFGSTIVAILISDCVSVEHFV